MAIENQTVALNVSTGTDTSNKSGMKVNMNGTHTITGITKDSSSTATVAYVLNSSKAVVATSGAFIGNVATFTPYEMTDSTTYYLAVDRGGAGFNHRFNQTGISYPYAGTILDWTGGLSSTSADTSSQVWSIDSAEFEDAPSTPTTQATNILFTSVTEDSMDLDWTNGDGDKRVVFMKETTTGTASPVDDTVYTANTVFGNGDQIGTTGWYCIFNGTGTNVTVTGLNETTYRAHVCEYNE